MPNAVEPISASPTRLADAYALLAEAGPAWRPIAGGTDVMVQIAGEIGEPPERLLDLWALDELRGIRADDDEALTIGALTTYTELRRSPLVARTLPVLAEVAATIGAAQIQNRGTIGGNVMNASPAGDTLPLLLAVDAALILGSSQGEREVPAAEFWPSYRTTAARPDELLLRIRIPLQPDRQVRFRKVGTRRAQAISKVAMALAWTSDGASAPWGNVHVALGSMAATPIRAPGAEGALEDARPTREVADAAASALVAEVAPIDDVRSTADYRRAVAGRILHRLVRDAGGW